MPQFKLIARTPHGKFESGWTEDSEHEVERIKEVMESASIDTFSFDASDNRRVVLRKDTLANSILELHQRPSDD